MNWITKIIKAGEKIKTAIRERATKEDIAKSEWTSCCRGPILKKDLEANLWVCPDCNKHHRIKPKQRFDILFGKNNYEVFKTPIPKDDPLNWTDKDLRPYIDATIEHFGFDRTIYAGDWPICLQATSLTRWVETLDRAFEGASEVERRNFYRNNANNFYRLGL